MKLLTGLLGAAAVLTATLAAAPAPASTAGLAPAPAGIAAGHATCCSPKGGEITEVVEV